MVRQHYHLVVTTSERDDAFIARTRAVVDRWVRHFKRSGYDQPERGSIDVGPCSGESCIALASEILQ